MLTAFALGLVCVAARPAQSTKLNAPFAPPTAPAGDVADFQVSADGRRVVYRAAQNAYDRLELFARELDGSGSSVRLNPPLEPDEYAEEVGPYALSADGLACVAWADGRLFRAALDGSSPALDLGSFPGGVRQISFTPDGRNVVVSVFSDYIPAENGLFIVPVDGSTPPHALVSFGNQVGVFDFELTPDGERAVFRRWVNQKYYLPTQVLSVRLDGTQAAKEVSAGPRRFRLLADGRTVLLWDWQGVYVAPVDGSIAPRVLTGSHPDRQITAVLASADGTQAVYVADHDTRDVYELYTVATDAASAPRKLSGDMVHGGDVASPRGDIYPPHFALTSDGARVVFVADKETNDAFELYSAPLDGSAPPVKLSGTSVPGGDVCPPPPYPIDLTFAITPDGQRVVFPADRDIAGVIELYSAPVDGSAPPTRVHAPLRESSDVVNFVVSPDGARVVFLADALRDEVLELFSARVDGSARAVRLNARLPEGGDVTDAGVTYNGSGDFAFTSDGRSVVYLADQELDDVFEVFVAPVDASAAPRRLNGRLAQGPPPQDVTGFEWTAHGERVVYTADTPQGDRAEFFAVDPDARAEAVLVSGASLLGARVGAHALSPDGRQLVFEAGDTNVTLLAASVTRGTEPVRLCSAEHSAVGGSFAITPDSLAVVFIDRIDQQKRLFLAPLAGGAPLELAPPPSGHGQVYSQLRAGKRIVFRADYEHSGVIELFSVSLDGRTPARKLSGPLVAGGDVDSVVSAPDGARVFYLADQDADGVHELFSAPTAGGAPAQKLNGPLVNGGDVERPLVSPDGRWVAFLADAERDGVRELFSAPADGSRAARKLNAILASGEVVSDGYPPIFSADGRHTCYLAAEQRAGVIELHAAPSDGASAAVTLNDPLAPNERVHGFWLAGARVVFATGPQGTPNRLFVVALDRSTAPVQLSPLGSIDLVFAPPQIPAGSSAVLFRMDHRLFAAALDGASGATLLSSRFLAGPRTSPDGLLVAFLESSGELFARRIDASGPVHALAPDLPVFAQITAFAFDPSSQRVLYLADRDANSVVELYSTPASGVRTTGN